MGMKPRIDPFVNKKIDPKLCTEPHPDRGNEDYTRLEPFTVTVRAHHENDPIPGTVTEPDKNG